MTVVRIVKEYGEDGSDSNDVLELDMLVESRNPSVVVAALEKALTKAKKLAATIEAKQAKSKKVASKAKSKKKVKR